MTAETANNRADDDGRQRAAREEAAIRALRNGQVDAVLDSRGVAILQQSELLRENRRQREMLQGIFDNVPVMLIIWDLRLSRFTLNRHAEKVLGWTTADANRADFMRMVCPDPDYRAQIMDYMQADRLVWREWQLTTQNGDRIPVEWANVNVSGDTMVGIGVDLRHRKNIENKLRRARDNLEERVEERTSELRALTSRLFAAEETERQRIASGLHDEVGQLLAAAQLKLARIEEIGAGGEIDALVLDTDDLLNRAADEIRGLTFELSSAALFRGGFAAAVKELCGHMYRRHGVRFDLRTPSGSPAVPESLRPTLYNGVRELLHNVVKHSEADRATITLETLPGEAHNESRRLRITVQDSGRGFDSGVLARPLSREGGFGLRHVRERLREIGGRFRIHSIPGDGCRAILEIDLPS